MLSLWLGFTLLRPCGCRACNSALRGGSRRVTTAARRRKPSLAEILTACYSTVILSATCADAFRKDRRRIEIDQKLDAARKALVDLQNSDATRKLDARPYDTPTPDMTRRQMIAVWGALKNIYNDRSFMEDAYISRPVGGWDLVKHLKIRLYNCPDRRELSNRRKTDYDGLERAAVAEQQDPTIRLREARDETHLFYEVAAVERLVCRFVCRAKRQEIASRSTPWLRDAIERMLNKGGVEYAFPEVDRARWRRNVEILTQHLRQCIASSGESLRQKIGKVCYNLLVSAYAPDIFVYNTLIVAFSRAYLNTFADIVIWSFFHERCMRPTALTYVLVLNHYSVRSDYGNFLKVIGRIAGCDGEVGGKIARRHIEECERGGKLGKWARDDGIRTQIGEWVFQHVPLTRNLMNEIVRGLVRFKLFQQAVYLYFACMACKFFFSPAMVRNLLDECVNALDRRAAVELIRGLINHSREWKAAMMTGDVETDWYLINRIYTLLEICGLRCGPEQVSEQYLDALGISPASLAGLLADLDLHQHWLRKPCFPLSVEGEPSVVRSQSRLLQIQSLRREVDVVRGTTRSLESTLLYPCFPLEFRLLMVQFIGEQALEYSSRLMDETGELLNSIVGFGPWLVPLLWDRRMCARELFVKRQRLEQDYLARVMSTESEAELEDLMRERHNSREAEVLVAELRMSATIAQSRRQPEAPPGIRATESDPTRDRILKLLLTEKK
ncbi:hypothetical protein L249_7134 [Ophiocordyceps polyrhachis-furcata BCC 54312]|uniref:Pentatricopeptide repeat domain-containing protein n=1 Tax=Ophiocordyceps polyrhachis-furcata BCC 54312 TaxID=1330021 RepID=A0A367LAB1_9HYPO|nr:hypothetical protein L249_7134 [Ophiocordyceps polyrhachis-furcata BCC 54312]